MKPAYLVDGDLEQKFIQDICPGSPVRKINCNGDKVSLAEVAKKVGTLARLLHKQCNPIVVVIDRENRDESSSDIELELYKLLLSENINASVIVGVADRQIENWILADIESFCRQSGADPSLVDLSKIEGSNGKKYIKKLMPKNTYYAETLHGVKWLKAASPHKMALNSKSFARVAKMLEKLSCWWLHQENLKLELDQ